MIELGDRVTSRHTGELAIGTVISVSISGQEYARIVGKHPLEFESWAKFYPDWANEPVAIVKFDEPQKCTSKQEIREGLIESMEAIPSDELVDYEYSKVPMVMCSAYPIEDLERWSDYI